MTPANAVPGMDGLRSGSQVVDGVRLHYWLGGDPNGSPVILWHGFLATGYAWRKALASRVAGPSRRPEHTA